MNDLKKFLVVSTASLFIAPLANAHEDKEHKEQDNYEKRSHGKHVHGLGELNIAVENNIIEMNWRNPAINILGFGVANTEQQKEAVAEAERMMSAPQQLFEFTAAAGCEVDAVDVEYIVLNGDHEKHGHDEYGHDEYGHDEYGHDEHGHDEHGHDEHGHDEHGHNEHGHNEHGHNEHGHNEHGHDEHGHDEHGHKGGHADFEANYTFECENIDALEAIDTEMFGIFPLIEKTNVQLITPDKQTAVVLDKDNSKIDL